MQALHGNPGSDGIENLPSKLSLRALNGDGFLQISGCDGSSAKTVQWNWGKFVEPLLQEQPARLTGPVQFVWKLLEHWQLETGDAVGLLGFDQSDADYVHAVLEGREQLRGKDVRHRISHLYGIRKTLRFLFRDLETENAWLGESHRLLENKSPMSLLLSGSMENLLAVKDYVDTFAGR